MAEITFYNCILNGISVHCVEGACINTGPATGALVFIHQHNSTGFLNKTAGRAGFNTFGVFTLTTQDRRFFFLKLVKAYHHPGCLRPNGSRLKQGTNKCTPVTSLSAHPNRFNHYAAPPSSSPNLTIAKSFSSAVRSTVGFPSLSQLRNW